MDRLEERPRIRGWMLGTGILLVLVGFAFLLLPLLGTLAAGIAAGTLLLAAGIAQVVEGVGHRGKGRGWTIALGVLAAFAGVLLLADPIAGMIGFTALIAGYLIAGGAMRLVVASQWSPAPGWGWMLFNGAVSILLGVLILSGWPGTGFWTIGVFLGVDALLAGFSRVARSIVAGATDDEMIPSQRG